MFLDREAKYIIKMSSLSILLLLLFLNLFILGCIGSSLLCGLSLVAASGGYSSLRWVGFALWWLLLLQSLGSRCVGFSSCGSQALEHRLSSYGTRA